MSLRLMPKFSLFSLPANQDEDHSVAVEEDALPENHFTPRAADLQHVAEQIPGILWTTDLELNITRCVGNALARLNPSFQRWEGMPISEFFGVESAHSPVLDAHYHALGGHAHSFEFPLGGVAFCATVEPLFNSDWNLVGTVGVATEVVVHRQVCDDERLEKLTRQHETDTRQALCNLGSGLAHHFQQLFSAMSGYAAVVGMSLPADHLAHRWVVEMQKVAECASDLADQVLCPNPTGGRGEELVCLSDLIQERLQVFQMMLPKRISLQADLATDGAAVLAEVQELRRLLVSLLYNASASIGGDEGIISISTQVTHGIPSNLAGQATSCDLPEGDYVWLQVSDTGRELDDAARARIFEPFAGLSGRGLGLGRAIAIAAQMHGTVEVSSKPGLGTTCHVFLPVCPGSRPPQSAPECFF